MSSLRAFIAIQIPEKIKKEIADQTAELRRAADRSVRWVAPENIHLTLKFLGEVATEKIENLGRALATETARHKPFPLTVRALGAYPNLRHPRVIWIGLGSAAGLELLERGIGQAVGGLGLAADDKPFSAHLTIGRVREQIATTRRHTLATALEGTRLGTLGTFAVETVTLFRSDLHPGGPSYTCLLTAALGGQFPDEVNSESA